MQKLVIAFVTTAAVALATPALAQSLKGSSASMTRQNQEAVRNGYSFLENGQAVNQFVDRGHLVKVSPNRYMDLHDVSYPYARPGVKMFLDRLSSQYTAACGEKMTITSLTRPLNRQPANASAVSVHPTGMAADLRIAQKSSCRSWLEKLRRRSDGRSPLTHGSDRDRDSARVRSGHLRTLASQLHRADSCRHERTGVRPARDQPRASGHRGNDEHGNGGRAADGDLENRRRMTITKL